MSTSIGIGAFIRNTNKNVYEIIAISFDGIDMSQIKQFLKGQKLLA